MLCPSAVFLFQGFPRRPADCRLLQKTADAPTATSRHPKTKPQQGNSGIEDEGNGEELDVGTCVGASVGEVDREGVEVAGEDVEVGKDEGVGEWVLGGIVGSGVCGNRG
jgi:hypothetical protein